MNIEAMNAEREARENPSKFRPCTTVTDFVESCMDDPFGLEMNAGGGWFIANDGRRIDYEVVVTHVEGKQVNRMWKPYKAWWRFWR